VSIDKAMDDSSQAIDIKHDGYKDESKAALLKTLVNLRKHTA
jgi:hypothetical protein